jgi:hypothetical protein
MATFNNNKEGYVAKNIKNDGDWESIESIIGDWMEARESWHRHHPYPEV